MSQYLAKAEQNEQNRWKVIERVQGSQILFLGEAAPLYAVLAIEAHVRWGIAPLRLLASGENPEVIQLNLEKRNLLIRSVCEEGGGLSDEVAPRDPQKLTHRHEGFKSVAVTIGSGWRPC